jgi:subtilisin family serine protease
MRKLALLLLSLSLAGSALATTFTPELVEKLNGSSDNELIRILITFEEQAQFNWLVEQTARMNKAERRAFVVDHLKQLAEWTQADVRLYLEDWEAAGKVQHLRSVSIVNLMHCLATPEVIRDLSNYPEIAEVAYDPERFMLDEEARHARPAGKDGLDEIAWGVADVHAPEVWQQGFRGAGALVSILDTGVNYNHVDLADHMWDGGAQYPYHGYDFANNDNDPMDLGPLGHGTHVAGSVASDGTAGSQCGVAPDATIMAVQVWSGAGYGNIGDMISGIDFSVEHGVDIINMSGGIGGGGSTSDKQQFRTACNNALVAGVIASFAAGNEAYTSPPNSVRVPGNCPPPWLHPDQLLTGDISNVVTCGATQSNHSIASFSSLGPVTWQDISPWFDYAYNPGMGLIDPDISAPGVDVKSCLYSNNTGYTFMSGTSMATPHVAGAMALLLSKDPSLTPALIDMYLETYAEDLGAVGKDNIFGSGLMNVYDAINAIPVGTGPYLVVSDKEFDDIGGNNNGAPDPGETCSMIVTLYNVGQGDASNIVGTLSTTDPYLTITQTVANYPDLSNLEQGQGSPAYLFDVDSACPQGQYVSCDLHVTADSAYTTDIVINFVVGDPANSPSGPDAYGYLAYDPFDAPELPVYDWVEISADSGGPGSLVNFTMDDQVFQYVLPFSFQYYGAVFDTFSVAANGWVGMGVTIDDDYSNSGIPDADGPPNMIAPYWEDLSPQRTNSGKVWIWQDMTDHRLIVEWNHIEQYAPTGSFETFQVILHDPVYYPTGTGDGRIIFQYKDMSTTATGSEGTIGIENATQTDGIQYFFDGGYDMNAHQIEDGFALLFTTPAEAPDLVVTLTPYGTPIQIPAAGGSFDFNIAIANNGVSQVVADVWCDVTLPNGSPFGPVLGPVNLTMPAGFSGNRDRTQDVPEAAPIGMYSYNAYAGTYPNVVLTSDSFPFEKLATGDGVLIEGWNNYGESLEAWMTTMADGVVPGEFSLEQNYPNPFNPLTSISFGLPEAGIVKLAVYDILGRQVALLVNGNREAGSHTVTFDASNLASGLYIYRFEAGDFTALNKMVLMK